MQPRKGALRKLALLAALVGVLMAVGAGPAAAGPEWQKSGSEWTAQIPEWH